MTSRRQLATPIAFGMPMLALILLCLTGLVLVLPALLLTVTVIPSLTAYAAIILATLLPLPEPVSLMLLRALPGGALPSHLAGIRRITSPGIARLAAKHTYRGSWERTKVAQHLTGEAALLAFTEAACGSMYPDDSAILFHHPDATSATRALIPVTHISPQRIVQYLGCDPAISTALGSINRMTQSTCTLGEVLPAFHDVLNSYGVEVLNATADVVARNPLAYSLNGPLRDASPALSTDRFRPLADQLAELGPDGLALFNELRGRAPKTRTTGELLRTVQTTLAPVTPDCRPTN